MNAPTTLARAAPPSAPTGPSTAPPMAVAAAPRDYRSTTPVAIKWSKAVLLTLAFAWALSTAFALRATDVATRTIGHDTSASVVAAERIRGLLADANGDFADVMLTGDRDDGMFMSALRQDVRDAETLSVDAAQNITYGDEEKGPIVTIARAMAEFEQAVGRARGEGVGRARSLPDAKVADDVMHFTILPAAAALNRANFDYLTKAYERHASWRLTSDAFLVAAPLALLLALAAVQFDLFRRTRRMVNPGLAAASVVVLLLGADVAYRHQDAEHALYVAKEQAFDSIAALAVAKSMASDANAAESYWLLAGDDRGAKATYAADFRSRADRVVGVPPTVARNAMASGQRFEGLLGDELSNITFPGEREAAVAATKDWLDYLAIDGQIRALEDSGQSAKALALDVGVGIGESNWAFARFVEALDRTVAINQVQFDRAVARSEADVNPALYGALLAAWLLASGAAYLGLQLRAAEYEF